MTMEIRMLTLGIVSTNAYLVGNSATGEAVLIDPVDDAEHIKATADAEGWTIKLILATHAHFDHVLASKALKEMTGAPFYIHEETVSWLETLPNQGAMFGMPRFPEAATPDRLLTSEPETIEAAGFQFQTLYTPGHAPGHLAFFVPEAKVVFSGDTLFMGNIGRTDLPGGNYDTLMHSIIDRLLPLGDEVRVLCGHGVETTIAHERRTNPFVINYDG